MTEIFTYRLRDSVTGNWLGMIVLSHEMKLTEVITITFGNGARVRYRPVSIDYEQGLVLVKPETFVSLLIR